MIKVNRGTAPASIVNNEVTWKAELTAAKAGGDKKAIELAEGRYRQSDVKDALELAFNDKCAYCESEITSVTYGHIEHYYPKSKYPSKAFSWGNLLLSCPRCNDQKHKGNEFPLKKQGGPIVNPCSDEPCGFFNFIYDPLAKLALVQPLNSRGVVTERMFKLNIRKGLVRRRSKLLRNLIYIKQKASSDPEARAIIAESKMPQSEFSAWAKALL
jgi:uncharacterized protein (TIGR02646 family)